MLDRSYTCGADLGCAPSDSHRVCQAWHDGGTSTGAYMRAARTELPLAAVFAPG